MTREIPSEIASSSIGNLMLRTVETGDLSADAARDAAEKWRAAGNAALAQAIEERLA